MKTLGQRNGWIKGLTGIAVMMTVFCMTTVYSQAAEGTMLSTAKIRSQTSTDSEVLGSVTSGKTIDILEAVKDSAGTVWYKVSVSGGGSGYIRGDMVQTSESVEITTTASESATTTTSASEASSETASEPEPTVPTSIGEQAAVVKSDSSVRIRSGASTAHSAVTSLPGGTAITLIGEANDSAGNKWYQMTCNYNNRTVEGYIRSDLITIGTGEAAGGDSEQGTEGSDGESTEGEGGEGTEGENPEGEGEPVEGEETPEPEPVEEEHNDYEVVYRQDDAGEYYYYLYDNINGNMQKVSDLYAVVNSANEQLGILQDRVDTEKIIIIVLAVVIVILIVVITILLFKIRDLYYDDYDEDEEDEDEEEEEPAPVRKKVKKVVVEEEPPVRKKKPEAAQGQPKSRNTSQGQPKAKDRNGEIRAAQSKEPAGKAPARKPQNFLVDDDEFEFEFLNMDDKDL